MQADIRNPEIADYLAGMLAKRIGLHADTPLQDISSGCTHASEFLAVISQAQGEMKFHLQVAAGSPYGKSRMPRQLFGELAEVITDARRSLNRVAEEFVFLGE